MEEIFNKSAGIFLNVMEEIEEKLTSKNKTEDCKCIYTLLLDLHRYVKSCKVKNKGLLFWKTLNYIIDNDFRFMKLLVLIDEAQWEKTKNRKELIFRVGEYLSVYCKEKNEKLDPIVEAQMISFDCKRIVFENSNTIGESLKEFDFGQKIDVRVHFQDASVLTQEGFIGKSISNVFEELSFSGLGGRLLEKEKYDIVFLDEFDKLLKPCYSVAGAGGNPENVSEHIQAQLLTIFGGTSEKIKEVDPNKILFVLGGAFPELEELSKKENRNSIGFFLNNENDDEKIDVTNSIAEKLIKIGAQKELVARIKSIAVMEALNKEQLRSVIEHPRGAFKRKQLQFAANGTILEFETNMIEEFIDVVYGQEMGVRAIENFLNSILERYEYDIHQNKPTRVLIGKGVLYGLPPTLIG